MSFLPSTIAFHNNITIPHTCTQMLLLLFVIAVLANTRYSKSDDDFFKDYSAVANNVDVDGRLAYYHGRVARPSRFLKHVNNKRRTGHSAVAADLENRYRMTGDGDNAQNDGRQSDGLFLWKLQPNNNINFKN